MIKVLVRSNSFLLEKIAQKKRNKKKKDANQDFKNDATNNWCHKQQIKQEHKPNETHIFMDMFRLTEKLSWKKWRRNLILDWVNATKKTFFKKPEVHTPLFHFHYDQILIYLKLLLRYINMCWPTLIVV